MNMMNRRKRGVEVDEKPGKQVTISKFFRKSDPRVATLPKLGTDANIIEKKSNITHNSNVTADYMVNTPIICVEESPPRPIEMRTMCQEVSSPLRKQKAKEDSSPRDPPAEKKKKLAEESPQCKDQVRWNASNASSGRKLCPATLTKLSKFTSSGSCNILNYKPTELQNREHDVRTVSSASSLPPEQNDSSTSQNSSAQPCHNQRTYGRESSTSNLSKFKATKYSVPACNHTASASVADAGECTSSGATDSPCVVGGKGKMKYTPLEQQFMEIKQEHPDVLLLVECGYKFRMFAEDAEIAARELNIFAHPDHNFSTASFPTHRLFVHVRRLVAAGYKVGVVKQIETAALKAAGDNRNTPFKRQLTAVYTKATLIGEDVQAVGQAEEGPTSHLRQGSYIMSVCESLSDTKKAGSAQIGFVAVDAATGDIIYDCFQDNNIRQELETRVSHICPTEFLLPQTLSDSTERIIRQAVNHSEAVDDRIRVEQLQDEVLSFKKAFDNLQLFYSQGKSQADIKAFLDVMKLLKPVVCCLNASLTYLQEFKLDTVLLITRNFRKFSSGNDHMILNACTLRNLEVFHNQADGKVKGSLFHIMDHTTTSFGSRMLRNWVAHPLQSAGEISQRLDAVEEVMNSDCVQLKRLRDMLKKLPDLETSICSIFHQKCSPLDFCLTLKALERVYEVLACHQSVLWAGVSSSLLLEAVTQIPELLEGVSDVASVISEEGARKKEKTTLFENESQFPSIIECKKKISQVLEELKSYRREIRLQLHQPGLEYVTVMGTEFLVEVKNDLLSLIPGDWLKISSTKAVSRFHPPFVLECIKKLAVLKEQLEQECNTAWYQFLRNFEIYYMPYRATVKHLATLDCIFSLASLAKHNGYTRPTINSNSAVIEITQGRHPVVEGLVGEQGQYVPNDTQLKERGERCMVITGPNMGGKSSYIKQVALITIMAHVGSFVPAESANIGIIDGIYTRMGASDELFQKRSTFMVELQETANIMKTATDRSLVILDELGRGTSTHDGVAIACATLKYFMEEVKCLTLFVTHYPQVTEIQTVFHGVMSNYHMAYHIEDEGKAENSKKNQHPDVVSFLYQLVKGRAHSSYGLNVARLAGIPPEIINVAASKSHELEKSDMKKKHLKSCITSFVDLWHCCSKDGFISVCSLES